MADSESELPFIRNLASSDRKLRVASLESLQTYVKSLKSLTVLEASKLWKGLFYALWMTDRPLPQQALATDLGNLLFKVRPACVDAWLHGFWTVVGAQWTGIDVLRLEKFLLLVRRVFAAHIQLVKEKGYDGKEADVVLDVLREWPFDKEGDLRRVPVGIRLHALDIWIDELEKLEVLTDSAAQTFVRKMGDMVEELKRCPVKPVRQRSAENLEDDRLPWVAKEDEMDEDDEDEEWGGIQD